MVRPSYLMIASTLDYLIILFRDGYTIYLPSTDMYYTASAKCVYDLGIVNLPRPSCLDFDGIPYYNYKYKETAKYLYYLHAYELGHNSMIS